MFRFEDTICAVATAIGNSGINIIRISGKEALPVALKIFRPLKAKAIKPRYMYLGDVYNGDEYIDRVLGVFFKGPYSYTGEDIFEIHCHGGIYSSQKIVETLISNGARPAEAGEFSRRAFLNGKIDLSQAEGIADQIGALSEKGARNAALQMRGSLSNEISEEQKKLTDVIAQVEAIVEYPEENLEDQVSDDLTADVKDIVKTLSRLKDSYKSGKILKEGARIAILGRPNVGKSSLLNSILNTERVIVSDIPGTTRDVVTEYYIYRGIPLIFSDTAGIRETKDIIERIGVDRSRAVLKEADIALLLLDSSEELTREDMDIYNDAVSENGNVIVVINKTDLENKLVHAGAEHMFSEDCIEISAKNGAGIDRLLETIYNKVITDASMEEGTIITNSRQEYALLTAIDSLNEAINGFENNIGFDLISIDLHEAWNSIGEITGETLDEKIIDRIFEKFCLGK